MPTTDFVDGVTLSAAAWADDVDIQTYAYLTSVAGTNTITATGPAAYGAYTTGRPIFWFLPAVTNTAATTINITPSGGSALGAKNIFLNGGALVGGELTANVPVAIIYDGTQFNIINGSLEDRYLLSNSVAANALTVTLAAGSLVTIRSATAATGISLQYRVTTALTVVVPDTATLGTANSTAFRLWFVVFDDAGTLRLGVINALSGTSIYALSGWGIASSTAVGTGSDSAQVFYTGSAVTSKGYAVVGTATWESGLATAGTWASAATRLQAFGPGVKLPGQTVQTSVTQSSAVATGTTTIPHDDTIPQSTEGDEYVTQAITPTSAANVLKIDHLGYYASSTANIYIVVALFQDSTANALKALDEEVVNANGTHINDLHHEMLAATTSATTFKIRAGGSAATTITFNGSASGRIFGGVAGSYLSVTEVMA